MYGEMIYVPETTNDKILPILLIVNIGFSVAFLMKLASAKINLS